MANRRRELSKIGIRQIGIRQAIVRIVENIIGFQAELKILVLPNHEFFMKHDIQVKIPGTDKGISA